MANTNLYYNDFPPFYKVKWGASDTETLTFIDGEKVSSSKLIELGKHHEQKWFRQHATVTTYAWQFSDGIHYFTTTSFDDYLNFLCEHKVKNVWFYNAKFDFAQMDYQILTHAPIFEVYDKAQKGKDKAWKYASLHSNLGARFHLKLWIPYKNKGKGSKNKDRHEHVHPINFYDFNNIFKGGLEKLLKEFNVTDLDGIPIRKLEMDYQEIGDSYTAEQLQYMKNDTIGLYHLIRIANNELKDLTGYQLVDDNKPDIMTAGGLAKKVMLKYLYPKVISDRYRIKKFQEIHPIDVDQDNFFRKKKLYAGGICQLNDRFKGVMKNIPFHRYDVNSEYPYIMANMLELYGPPMMMDYKRWLHETPEYKDTHKCILYIKNIYMTLRDGMIPIWRNPFTGKYSKEEEIYEEFLMFEDEFEELKNWYKIDVIIEQVLVIRSRKNPAFANFVNYFYDLKQKSKKEGKKAITQFAKIILNSSYGKLAERCERVTTQRMLSTETGAVHLVETGTETNAKSLLSVIQGSYVTALARIYIMSNIRKSAGSDTVANTFIYVDTDSIHTISTLDNTDDFRLGAFKDESPEGGFNILKYIAPKCYMDGTEENGEVTSLEIHSKGINVSLIESEFMEDNKYKPKWYIDKRFAYGQKFQPLAGMNIVGGKALIPIEKYLAKPLEGFTWTDFGFNEA